jgi:hypothetical protein
MRFMGSSWTSQPPALFEDVGGIGRKAQWLVEKLNAEHLVGASACSGKWEPAISELGSAVLSMCRTGCDQFCTAFILTMGLS